MNNPWVKLVLCLWCLLCSTPSQRTILACTVSQKRPKKIMELILCFVRRVKELFSLSTLLSFCFFCPAFLCRCGEQPTSAVFFGQRNLKLKQNIQVLSSNPATVWRERRKRGRDSEMTISLFFSTLISLEDKWNHMLALVLGEKKNRAREEENRQVLGWWEDEEEQSRADRADRNWFSKNTSYIIILSTSYFSSSVVHLVIEDKWTNIMYSM